MTYSEKLRDPRWQRKRLEIMQRDGFRCQLCKDNETELQVHHSRYSGEPWEAEDVNLHTLCKHCHYVISTGSDGCPDFFNIEWHSIYKSTNQVKDGLFNLFFVSNKNVVFLVLGDLNCECTIGEAYIHFDDIQKLNQIIENG